LAKDFIKEIVRLERDRNALGIENLDNLEVNKSQYNTFTSENKTFTDKNPNAPGQDSLYEAVIKDTPLHREGIIDLEHLRDTFARPGRVSSTSVTHTTLDAVNNTMLNRQISRNNLNAAQGTKATEAFVKEIVKNDAQRDTLGINEHPLLNNSDVTLNTKYLKSVKVGGKGAEQTYTSERHFTADAPGEWISDLAEISGIVRSQATAAMAGPLQQEHKIYLGRYQ